MAKASAQITLTYVIDVKATYRYYLLQSSTTAWPSKPTTYPPSSSWDDTEPSYTEGSTNSLYFVDCTVFNDNSFKYSEVSKSTSYEAAKAAYNKATAAQTLANNAKLAIDSLSGTVTSQAETITTHGTKISTLEQTAQGFSISLETLEADAIVSTQEQFYNSDSPTSLTGGSWGTDQPTWTEGKYIWRRTLVTYGDGSPDYTPSQSGICITGNTGAQGAAGSSIWTTTTAPTTPNYTFTISNLTGGNGTAIKVGDVIKYSYYMYTVTSVSSTTVLAPTRVSIRGSTGASGKWYAGTAITGTSTTATIFSGSGISSAIVGDMYLNTSTSNTYRCTTAGAASAAKWVYVANIQGEDGPQGDPGEDGRMLYATCSTAATTAAKVATLSNGTLTLYAGATVSVKFTYANNVSTPTLNVASTGAKTIRLNNAAITNSAYYWPANATITFVYDGTYWNVSDAGSLYKANEASKTASNYMSYDSTNGLVVGNKTSGSWSGFRTQITASAFNVLNSAGTVLASYGAKIVELGKNATDAIISFCGGKGTISFAADTEENRDFLNVYSPNIRLKGDNEATLWTAYQEGSFGGKAVVRTIADEPSHDFKVSILASGSENLNESLIGAFHEARIDVGVQDGIYMEAYSGIDMWSRSSIDMEAAIGAITLKAAAGVDLIGNEVNATSDTDVNLKAERVINLIPGGTVGTDGLTYNYGDLELPAGTAISWTTTGDRSSSVVQYNADDNVFFGNGGYACNEGKSWFDGNEVYIRSKNAIKFTSVTAGLTSREYGINKVLWSGGMYMSTNQTATLSEAISAQPNGIVLLWADYNTSTGTVSTQGYWSIFIPKQAVADYNNKFFAYSVTKWSSPTYIVMKGFYLTDTKITGHSISTSEADPLWSNSKVLVKVYGV